MPNLFVKVNAKNQITIPESIREQLNIKAGDHILVDVQENIMVLLLQPASYTNHLQGLHSEIWNGVNAEKYLSNERDAWSTQVWEQRHF
jgi:AbrB family looped-hinge helix DNA binding protein